MIGQHLGPRHNRHLGEHLHRDAGGGGGLEESNDEFPNNKKRNTDYTTALTRQQQQEAVWLREITQHIIFKF